MQLWRRHHGFTQRFSQGATNPSYRIEIKLAQLIEELLSADNAEPPLMRPPLSKQVNAWKVASGCPPQVFLAIQPMVIGISAVPIRTQRNGSGIRDSDGEDAIPCKKADRLG